MITWWVMANGILAGLGAVIALAHPFTILSSILAAPLTWNLARGVTSGVQGADLIPYLAKTGKLQLAFALLSAC